MNLSLTLCKASQLQVSVAAHNNQPNVFHRATLLMSNWSLFFLSDANTSLPALSLAQLIPSEQNLTSYYRYKGSLTTPGCTESVIWTLFENPIPLSMDQVSIKTHFLCIWMANFLLRISKPSSAFIFQYVLLHVNLSCLLDYSSSFEIKPQETLKRTWMFDAKAYTVAYRLQNYDNGPHDIAYFKGTKQFSNQFNINILYIFRYYTYRNPPFPFNTRQWWKAETLEKQI